jgi:hypothetical protein
MPIDRNPHENAMLDRLDYKPRRRAPSPPPHRTATHDPRHLVPRKEALSLSTQAALQDLQQRSKGPAMTTVVAKGPLKVVAVLPPEVVAELKVPDDGRFSLAILAGEGEYTAELNPKTARKAIATAKQLGANNCAAIIQGRLQGEKIMEAGLVVQPVGQQKK